MSYKDVGKRYRQLKREGAADVDELEVFNEEAFAEVGRRRNGTLSNSKASATS